ncbi:hypothetical protein [Caballeronia sp. INDeC2]|uniref:hypothetical protein n=1 Tax=Caballeronia sp. INDeC2 TaxID=2921747 RepID=UPI0020278E2C|nr:hypothetical protein [Caballeronia sp. INDeC2]
MLNGEYKVAQYGQWDGYPDGQGLTALTFLRDTMDKPRFMSSLEQTFQPTREQIDQWYRDAGADDEAIETGWISMGVSENFKLHHPSMSRDTGAKILSMIQSANGAVPLRIDADSAGDSLSCEWVWLADFDKGTFEAFKGFNTSPLPEGERFASFPLHPGGHTFKDNGGEPYRYHQCKFVASWPLDALPTDDDFLAAFKSNDGEE